MIDPFDLSDSVSVIIGGTGVLGSTLVEGLCCAGSNVAIVGRDASKGSAVEKRCRELANNGELTNNGKATFIPCDTTSKGELHTLLDEVDKRYGRIDVVVNAAGVNGSTPFLEIDEAEWNHIMDVNLKGVFFACQVFGEYLIDQGEGGSIINISSMSGITPLSKVFTYSASKAGLINLSQNLAREWAPHNIRVNCIAPGFFPAEQNKHLLTDERTENIMRHTPMSRFGEPNELVGTTLLLASKEAGSFITGANIPVDGGYSAMTI